MGCFLGTGYFPGAGHLDPHPWAALAGNFPLTPVFLFSVGRVVGLLPRGLFSKLACTRVVLLNLY